MTAIAAAAITTAAIGAYGVYKGEKQKSDAKKLAASNKFIPQVMPGQVKEATNLAAENYYNGMPGTDAAKAMITNNGANAYYNASQGASSGGDLLDLAAQINQGSNVATNNLALQGANYKSDALRGYQGALNNEAGWEDRLYKNNVLDPYNNKANTAAAMLGAGETNSARGLDQIAGAGLNYASNKYEQDRFDALKNDPALAAAMAGSTIKKRGY